MIKRINFKLTVNLLLAIFSILVIFHILVVVGVIPYDLVWGGRLGNAAQMRQFEIVSIIINLLIMLVVAMRGGYIQSLLPRKLITVLIWIFVLLFSLNTVGNLLSKNLLESIIFTPLTLVIAVLCYRLTLENPDIIKK
jgi:hypothetical protein